MELDLPADLGRRYPSGSQKARAITEAWATDNLYCLACEADTLKPTRPNTKVIDYRCDSCEERYQLKSQRRPIGSQVPDAAFDPLARAVDAGTAPSFYFLHYDADRWQVRNLLLVPRFFLTRAVLVPRKPLSWRPTYVMCSLRLSRLPPDARIDIVKDSQVRAASLVRAGWQRFQFLRQEKSPQKRGWTADVLTCVRRLERPVFTTQQFYGLFEKELRELHPGNTRVKDKIRQQLQFLRDRGILEFTGRGLYRQVRWCPDCGHDLVADALPQDGAGHRRLACPECGAWLWR